METDDRDESADGLVGKHLIYTYENGWQYELYVKNAHTLDYRIHAGIVGGRWVNDQAVKIVQLAPEVFKISWDEPTGTVVSLAVNLRRRRLHGAAFFPKWIEDAPDKTICHQNEHLPRMLAFRDAGPTYPKLVIDEFADITFVEDCGADRHDVIACAPSALPAGYTTRRN